MLLEIAIVLGLVLFNGVFSGAEIAVISVRKTRLSELLEAGHRGAHAIAALRAEPERFLATVQVGVTVVGTTAAAFGGERLARHITPVLARVPALARVAPQVAFALVVALVSFCTLILGELVPKSLALRAADRYALRVARPLRALSRVARPLVWLLTATSNLVLRVFGDRTSFTETRLSPAELQELLDEAGRVGSLDARTSEIASRALDMRELTAADVMVARPQVVSLPLGASREELLAAAQGRRHARIPVYEGASRDNLVGYVAMKDLLVPALRGEPIELARHLRPLHFVPETVRAVDLLRDLQQHRMALAIVVEDTGAVAGLVTAEDLVEELVGDVVSEYDPASALYQREPDGAIRVLGLATIRDINRELGLELPEGEGYSTIGGLCVAQAQRIPEVGARIALPEGLEFEVLDASARRVRAVRLRLPAAAPAG